MDGSSLRRNPKPSPALTRLAAWAGLGCVLGLLAGPRPLHAVNFGSISLRVTVSTAAASGPLITHSAYPEVSFASYLSVPVTIIQSGSVPIGSARLFYRTAGGAAYTEASGPYAFSPDPAGQLFYQGRAIVPGTFFGPNGVDYYVEATDVNGVVSRFGTDAAPLNVQFESTFEATIDANAHIVLLPDGDLTDGNVGLEFPAGAVERVTTLRMTQLDTGDPLLVPNGNGLALSQRPVLAFDFNTNAPQIEKPVLVRLLYSDVDDVPGVVDGTQIDETTLRIFRLDSIGDWRFLGGTVDTTLNTVSALTHSFSLYALFPVTSLTSSAFRPAEKIITPNGDGQNDVAIFSGLSGAYDIRIFDVRGRRVRTVSTGAFPQWDGRDDDGNVSEAGVYVYQYRTDSSGDWVSGMIGVAR